MAARRKRDDAAASETPAAPATPAVAVAAGKDKSSPMVPKWGLLSLVAGSSDSPAPAAETTPAVAAASEPAAAAPASGN